MANSEITRLQNDAKGDAGLRQALVDTGNNLDKIVALAGAKGYKFSKADLQAAIAAGGAKAGELADDELGKVSGGLVASLAVSIVA
jgi:predicted ribosomally synthesized peptide with nif11-like leader